MATNSSKSTKEKKENEIVEELFIDSVERGVIQPEDDAEDQEEFITRSKRIFKKAKEGKSQSNREKICLLQLTK